MAYYTILFKWIMNRIQLNKTMIDATKSNATRIDKGLSIQHLELLKIKKKRIMHCMPMIIE